MIEIRSYRISSLASCLVATGALILFTLFMLSNAAFGGEAYCDACKGETGWNGLAKLDEIGNPQAENEVMAGLSTAQKNRVGIWNQPLSGFNSSSDSQSGTEEGSSSEKSSTEDKSSTAKKSGSEKNTSSSAGEEAIVRSDGAKRMLAPMDELSGSEILLDISENATSHIQGSIAIPYTQFLNGTRVKPIEELEEVLGQAGIASDDTVVIYGECMPCGGGPAPATFVYWLMKSLGQDNVRVLDGMVGDWQASGGAVTEDTLKPDARIYSAALNTNYTADYDYVMGGSAQIVDARSTQEFGEGYIPGALNYPYDSVIVNNRIKDESRLKRVFSLLDTDQPVVVYTNTGIKASPVWFALTMLGYEARLYSYEDYLVHEQIRKNRDAVNATS